MGRFLGNAAEAVRVFFRCLLSWRSARFLNNIAMKVPYGVRSFTDHRSERGSGTRTHRRLHSRARTRSGAVARAAGRGAAPPGERRVAVCGGAPRRDGSARTLRARASRRSLMRADEALDLAVLAPMPKTD